MKDMSIIKGFIARLKEDSKSALIDYLERR